MQWDWNGAMKCAAVLKNHCKWSRALFAYMYACFASMVAEEEGREDLKQEVVKVLASVPSLKRHFGGKKAFHEMLVVEK